MVHARYLTIIVFLIIIIVYLLNDKDVTVMGRPQLTMNVSILLFSWDFDAYIYMQ